MRARRCLSFLSIVSLPLLSVSFANAQQKWFNPPTGGDLLAAIEQSPPEIRGKTAAIAKREIPIYVFIPGILGSELTKTRSDGTKVTIWGDASSMVFPGNDIAYQESDVVEPKVLEQAYLHRRLKEINVDIYGGAIRTLGGAVRSKGKPVIPFAYDWRQSNRKSSSDLTAWLCQNRNDLVDRRVIFIAHSMGGLVLKHWLKHRYKLENCASSDQKLSDWLKIAKVVFLGTPHYGAPKAIAAFADQYNLLVDPQTEGDLAAWFDLNTISKALNEYGATFPSVYELLPVYGTQGCVKVSQDFVPFELNQVVGGIELRNKNIDIFDIDLWKDYGWPKNISSSLGADFRARFMTEKLPRLLKSANDFLCDLAGFQIEREFPLIEVMRFYGASQPTVCRIVVEPGRRAGNSPRVVKETRDCGPGDGTVPDWVAREGVHVPFLNSRTTGNSHTFLLGHIDFLHYIKNYNDGKIVKFIEAVGSTDNLVPIFTSLGYLGPPSRSGGPQFADLRKKVAAALGLSATNIYDAAIVETDPQTRMAALSAVTEIAEANDPVRLLAVAVMNVGTSGLALNPADGGLFAVDSKKSPLRGPVTVGMPLKQEPTDAFVKAFDSKANWKAFEARASWKRDLLFQPDTSADQEKRM